MFAQQVPAELLGGAVQVTGLVQHRATEFDLDRPFGAQEAEQLANEPRLADPWLSRQPDHLRIARPCPPPRSDQLIELGTTPDQRGEALLGGCQIESVAGTRVSNGGEDLDRLADALECVQAHRLEIDEAHALLTGTRADRDRAGGCDPLDPRRHVGSVAHHVAQLPVVTGAHVGDHGLAAVHADPYGQAGEVGAESVDGIDQREAGSDGTHAGERIGDGVSEVGEHAVTHEVADVASLGFDCSADGSLVRLDDGGELLDVQRLRHRGRSDEVAEHESDVSSFTVGRRPHDVRSARAGSNGRVASRFRRSWPTTVHAEAMLGFDSLRAARTTPGQPLPTLPAEPCVIG